MRSPDPRQVVRFMQGRPITRCIQEIRFKPKRMKWLANFLWKWLHKLEAIEYFTEQSIDGYEYTPMDQKKVFDYILKCIDNLNYIYHNPDEYKFVIGMAEFQELTNSPKFPTVATFNQKIGSSVGILNIPLEVIPWMSGIAMVKR